MPDLLAVDSLSYAYGGRVAVDGVSLTIARGECFGLLGPNGAGKTTLLSCIAGLRGDHRGSMRFSGETFTPRTRVAQRRHLGLVPQELAIYDELTAAENLGFFARVQGVAHAEVAAAVADGLALAGLADRAGDRVKTFSGGMKRRLNLAVGELHHPQLLLLDEPTVGVDPQSRNHLFECLLALKARGRTLVYTTHYMEEAERLCDRVAIMNEGKVLAVGTAAQLAQTAGVPGKNLETVFLELTGRRLRDDA
ncbi:MAG: ABC transporter ATP-binding protein [Planctomycetota bacterium]